MIYLIINATAPFLERSLEDTKRMSTKAEDTQKTY